MSNPIKTYYDEEGNLLKSEWETGGILHRVSGPALIRYRKDGEETVLCSEVWYTDGRVDRKDGPAWIWYNKEGGIDQVEYWLGDRYLEFWDFYERSSPDTQKTLLKQWLPYHV
jgi:hypothetical protein